MAKNRRGGKKEARSTNSTHNEVSVENRVPPEKAPKNAEMRWRLHYSSARKFIEKGDFHSAVLELQASVRFAEQLEDYRLANTFAELGYIALKLDDFETGRAFIKLAMSVRETIYGAAHPSVAIEYNNLAMTYEWSRDFTRARPYLEIAVSLLENHGQYETANQAEPYEGLASICLIQGNMRRAEQLCQRALEIRDKNLGRLHPVSIKTVQFFARILEVSGALHQAEEMRSEYSNRLDEYAESKSIGASAETLRKLLDLRDATMEKDDAYISRFLKLMARR